MQDARNNRGVVEAQIRNNIRDRKRMRKKGLAGMTQLAFMRLLRHLERFFHHRIIF